MTSYFFEIATRHLSGWVKVGLVVVSMSLLCLAQQDRGTILGTVLDSSGALMPNVKVVVENQGTGRQVAFTTDASGIFIAPELPVGTYQVTASFQGFKTEVRKDLTVRVQDRVQIKLALQPGNVQETVTVTGQAPLIETASNTLGGTIEQKQVQDLPLNGRDPNYLLAVIPGVNLQGNMFNQSMNGLNTGGQSVSLVTFLMDGVDANRIDANTIPITYGPSANRIARVNAEGIQEVRETENSFSAEYGQSAGAVVNIITRSGTNKLHGSAFEFFRNDKLDARSYFDPAPAEKPAFRMNQFGGSLGGPIKKDKVFFFFSYEGIRQRTGHTLPLGLVPTQSFRDSLSPVLQTVVATLPLPNAGPSADDRVGFYRKGVSDFLDEDSGFGRVDANLSQKDRISVRYNGNASLTNSYFGVGNGQVRPSKGLLQSAKVTYSHVFSPTLLNEASLGFNRMHIDPRAASDPTLLALPITNVGGMASIGPGLFDLKVADNSFSGLDTVSWVRGRNQFKFGTAITRNQQNKTLLLEGIESFPTLDAFAANAPFSVSTLGYPANDPTIGMRNTYYNFFVQDDIQVTRKLTVNAGLRYQYETSPTEVHGRQTNYDPATMTLDQPGSRLVNMPKTNFGPRLGFAYSPFHSGKTVVRGAYGIYDVNFNATLVQNEPVNGSPTVLSVNNIQNPGLIGFPFPSFTATVPPGSLGLNAIQRNWQTPYVQNWNFNIQQALGQNFRLQVGYVGNKGTHIITPAEDINRIIAGTAVRPDPNWGSISLLQANGYSNYNSLQTVLTKRMSHGLQFDVNYTYGHALDDSPPIFAANSDDHNPQLDYGTTESDVKHLLSFDYIYQIPTAHALPQWLAGGWQINGLAQLRSGLPIIITCGCDPLQVGQFNSRPDLVPGVPIFTGNPWPGTPSALVLNSAAFAAPPTGRIGDLGRGVVRGPAAYNFDFSLFKNFRIRESQTLQFRAEFFNIFNTPQFEQPSANLASPGNFGQSTSTLTTVSAFGTERQIQFGLRYDF